MILAHELDRYGNLVVDTDDLPLEQEEFSVRLGGTVHEARRLKAQLIWLHLPPRRADLAAACVQSGFVYHHADAGGLQLVRRLIPDAYIPEYATHTVGVGGVLLDDENRILVVQERRPKRRHYKLPGGAADPGEHLVNAVVREVYEETGVRGAFLSLNCFRHWHGYRYGKSDIYFVCRLKPLSSRITLDEREISEARWMPLDEYLNHEDTHPFNRRIVETTLNTPGMKLESLPGYGRPETHELMFCP